MVHKSLLCCLLVLGTLAWSQDALSRYEVFGGYSYRSSNFAPEGGRVGEHGWTLGASADATSWIGFKAEVAQYSVTYIPHEYSKTVTFLFGLEVSLPRSRNSRFRPFGEFLVGGAHKSFVNYGQSLPFFKNPAFAWAFGGGLDVRFTKHLWLRGEGDYLHDHFVTSDNLQQPLVPDSHARLVTGLVFRF